jgi:hypothetical protein
LDFFLDNREDGVDERWRGMVKLKGKAFLNISLRLGIVSGQFSRIQMTCDR